MNGYRRCEHDAALERDSVIAHVAHELAAVVEEHYAKPVYVLERDALRATQGTSDTAELVWPATLPADHPGFPGRHVDEVDLGTFDQNDSGVGKEEPAVDERQCVGELWKLR